MSECWTYFDGFRGCEMRCRWKSLTGASGNGGREGRSEEIRIEVHTSASSLVCVAHRFPLSFEYYIPASPMKLCFGEDSHRRFRSEHCPRLQRLSERSLCGASRGEMLHGIYKLGKTSSNLK